MGTKEKLTPRWEKKKGKKGKALPYVWCWQSIGKLIEVRTRALRSESKESGVNIVYKKKGGKRNSRGGGGGRFEGERKRCSKTPFSSCQCSKKKSKRGVMGGIGWYRPGGRGNYL